MSLVFGAKIPKGTGGDTITNVNGYTLHTFTTSGTYTPAVTAFVDILVVGGGGVGGSVETFTTGAGVSTL